MGEPTLRLRDPDGMMLALVGVTDLGDASAWTGGGVPAEHAIRGLHGVTLLLGEGAKFPRLMARYTETVVEPRRDVIRSVLRRGIETGELRPGIDVEVALFMMTGAMISRGKHQPEGISDGFAQRVVDELLTGITPR